MGEFSVPLWPTDRSDHPVLYAAEILGVPGTRTFYKPLPSGAEPLKWKDFLTGSATASAGEVTDSTGDTVTDSTGDIVYDSTGR